MLKNPSLVGSIDRFELEFVERQATPELVMKLVFKFTSADYRFRIPYPFLRYLVLNGLDQLFITGYTRLSYSPKTVSLQIRLR
jgi:hypothetical protein